MTQGLVPDSREALIRLYDSVVGGVDGEAMEDAERAYGGIVRAGKGKLVEVMASGIIQLAWQDAGGASCK